MAGTSPPPPRIEPGPGQESVWDYPRPPRVESVAERVRVVVDGVELGSSARALRVIETAGPPVYYLPPEEVRTDLLVPSRHSTFCEWKGNASYRTIVMPGGRVVPNAAWTFLDPSPGFEAIRDYLGFYAWAVDEAWVGEERATPQPGHFYGGWITSKVVGPFKGEPGTQGW
ncbi:MAG TPA: DUF427 domain-containing protein [Candidatus Limnocylindrales bacterium]|nr:DUF427 domain-containing protein [Candidatus Limnocylindrales bacterium]